MRYERLEKYVSLSQGLVVNKGTADLFSDFQDENHPYPLLRIVDFENGNHASYSKYVSKNVPPKNIIDEHAILFTRVTCQCFRGFRGVFHNNLFRVELINDEITEDYLYVVLQSNYVRKQALHFTNSSVVPDLSHDKFKSILIPVPDYYTQKAISDTYLSLQKKIENNTAICSVLEAMAKLIYDYWFVQFDFPDENGKPYKSSGGKMVWSDELKREIPDGWEVKPLEDYLWCNSSSITASDDYASIEYLDTSNLTENRIDIIQHINKRDGYPSRAKRIVQKNDILFSTVRPVQHHFGIIKAPVNNMIASTGFAVMSAKAGDEYNELFYMFITNDKNLKTLDTIANNSASSYPAINPSDILELKIALPKQIDTIKPLVKKIGKIFTLVEEKHNENCQLTSLRDFLLPMLMNGQVKVGKAGA